MATVSPLMLPHALAYAARGWRVMPLHGVFARARLCACGDVACTSPGKHPRTRRGCKDATTDVEQIRDWWGRWPTASIGIATGGGLVVVDHDPRHDPEGIGAAFCADLPPTYAVATGGGGTHYYYTSTSTSPVACSAGSLPGVDVRGEGGYVVAAPSPHISGSAYLVVDDRELAEIPEGIFVAPVTLPDCTVTSIPTRLSSQHALAAGARWIAKRDPAIEGQDGSGQALVTAAYAVAFAGGDVEAALALLEPWNARCVPPWPADLLRRKVEESIRVGMAARYAGRVRALDGGSQATSMAPPATSPVAYLARDGGQTLKRVENLLRALRGEPVWRGRLGYDDLRQSIMIDSRPWTEHDTVDLRAWLEREGPCVSWGAEDTLAAVARVAQERRINPLVDELRSLRWDGVPRVSTAARVYLGARDAIEDIYLSRWLLAAVTRAMQPGCKVDSAIVLEGEQGARKSTALQVLARREDWFSDQLTDFVSKDAAQSLHGRWIVEIAELTATRASDVEHAKAFLSRQVDRIRLPYARHTSEHPRRCVFAGSTNADHYLRDPTGARRWWPIRCRMIDIDALRRDLDQIHAECVVRVDAHEPCMLVGTELDASVIAQDARREIDAWDEHVGAWLRTQTSVTLGEVFARLDVPIDRRGTRETRRVCDLLRALGFRGGARAGGARAGGGAREWRRLL